jgi:hypothetical protein
MDDLEKGRCAYLIWETGLELNGFFVAIDTEKKLLACNKRKVLRRKLSRRLSRDSAAPSHQISR